MKNMHKWIQTSSFESFENPTIPEIVADWMMNEWMYLPICVIGYRMIYVDGPQSCVSSGLVVPMTPLLALANFTPFSFPSWRTEFQQSVNTCKYCQVCVYIYICIERERCIHAYICVLSMNLSSMYIYIYYIYIYIHSTYCMILSKYIYSWHLYIIILPFIRAADNWKHLVRTNDFKLTTHSHNKSITFPKAPTYTARTKQNN